MGYRKDLIKIQRRNWRVANLTVRFSGGPFQNGYDPDLMTNGYNPVGTGQGIVGGSGATASGMVVDSCRVYGCNAGSIVCLQGFGGFRCDSSVICNNIVDGLGIGDMSYSACKSRIEEGANEIAFSGRKNVVYGNAITGTFNGIGEGSASADSTTGMNCEVAYNTFSHLSDDAIELDTAHDINMLAYGNYAEFGGRSVSLAQTWTGPTFILWNRFANFDGGGIKGGFNLGKVLVQQNTITSTMPLAASYIIPGSTEDNVVFENNILGGSGGQASMMTGPTPASTVTTNWNMMDSTASSVVVLATINSTGKSLTQLRSDFGWEKNGVQRAHLFADTATVAGRRIGTLSLGDYSFSRHLARRIAGVNCGMNGPMYNYLGPDHGAVQRLTP